MKLSEWAKANGISYKTAWRWIKDGKFPVPYEQTATGTILVKTQAPDFGEKEALERQIVDLLQRVEKALKAIKHAD